MSIYDAGTASLSADGTVTGVGTTWRQPLTLIRVGATMIFNTTPASIVAIAEIISDTEIRVFNDKGFTAPAGTQYSILAHDGITVQGLAQDVAETLRYYQSRETEIAAAVDAFNQFDADAFQQNVTNVNNQSQQVAADALQVSSDKAAVSADKDSAAASAASAMADRDAAAESAAEAADSAASLDTSNLLRVDRSLSDLTDKQLSRENLDVYAKGETYSRSEISSRYSVTLKDFGSVGDGVADDSYAMNQLSAFVNARAKYSAPVHVIIPNGVYNYSNGLNFVRPVSVTAEQGATLNYLGTGAAIAIGDPSLDEDNPSADGFYQGEYTISGIRFIGGQSAGYGIYIRSYVFTPHIYNCEFMDFGTADSWAIYSQFECWDGLIKDCAFHNYYNKAAVGNFIGISGRKTAVNVFDGGNSRFTIQDCSMTSYDNAPLGYFAYINSVKCVVTGGNCHWSSGGILVGHNAHGSTIENFYTEVSTPNRPWMVTVFSEGGETAQNVLIKNCYANMHSEVIGSAGKIIGVVDEGVILRGWRVEDLSFSQFESGQTLINMNGNAGQFGNTYARIKPIFNPYSSGAGLTYTVVNNPAASVNAWSSDDIEEGFWTPTLGGGATYNIATGYYRKQGKMVTCEFDIHVNSIAGGETGRIGGLPFPNGSMTGAGTVGYYAELAIPVYWLGVRVDGGSNLITISGSTASAVGISGKIAALKSNSRIIGSVTYFTS